MTRTDLKIITFFLLYFFVGSWGVYFYEYAESQKALHLSFKWFIIPSAVLGVALSYYVVFLKGTEQAIWRKILGSVAILLVFIMVFTVSTQGFIILWNAQIGNQEKVVLRGTISELDYPEKKKPLNSYAVFINLDSTKENINLTVPTNDYRVGQRFERSMTRGSLGIVYSH
ncbi:hypothetical protein [Hymenobacter koreensis]|uniref:DUF4131 domain-containing protein n=1 Tax=Hymenobacter koreensis TaxID=1084523 RepID=A0ABP8IWY5_9BACT